MRVWNNASRMKIMKALNTFFLIGKLHTHLIGLGHMISPSILLLKKEVPFELELIGKSNYCMLECK